MANDHSGILCVAKLRGHEFKNFLLLIFAYFSNFQHASLKKFFFATSLGIWDLNSPTKDQIHAPCIGRWSLNHWIAGVKSHHVSFLYSKVRTQNFLKCLEFAECGSAFLDAQERLWPCLPSDKGEVLWSLQDTPTCLTLSMSAAQLLTPRGSPAKRTAGDSLRSHPPLVLSGPEQTFHVTFT